MKLNLLNSLNTSDASFRFDFVSKCFSFFLCLIFLDCTLSVINFFYTPDLLPIFKQAGAILLPTLLVDCLPEPREQLCYSVAVILMPPFILGSLLGTSALYRRLTASTQLYLFLFSLLLLVIGVLFLGFLLYRALTWNTSYFIRTNFLHLHTTLYAFLFFPVLLFFVFYRSNRWVKWVITGFIYTIIPAVFIVSFFTMIWNSDSIIRWTHHLNPLIFPLAQILQGKTLLVNCPSLYGMFPFFLSPLFHIVPFSVLSFSIVMAILSLFVFFSVWYFLRMNTSNKAILVIGFLASVYFCYIDGRIFPKFLTVRPDSFFQYLPIRMLFPYGLLALVTRFRSLQTPKRRWYFFIMFCMSLAPLWNFDSGFIAFCAWLGFLSYTELFQAATWRQALRPIIKHLLFCLLFLFLTISCYCVFAYFRTGALPNWITFFQFYIIFSRIGFYMIPIATSFHPWMIVTGIYLFALLLSIQGLIKKEHERLNTSLFLLAILGFGLFPYFLGRSHEGNLYPLMIIPVLIITLLIDHAIGQVMLRNKNYYLFMPLCLMGLFFTASAIPSFLLWSPTILQTWAYPGFASMFYPSSGKPSRNIAFIRNHTQPGEAVFIYNNCYVDGIYHTETRTRSSLDLPSSTDYLLKTDMETLQSFFTTNQSAKIFLLPGAFPADMAKIFDSRYLCAAQDEETKIRLMVPINVKPLPPHPLPTLFHRSPLQEGPPRPR